MGEPSLHGSGLFPSPMPLIFFPGMPPPPPCTPQPILWALSVKTLPVKAEFSAISSGQLFPALPELPVFASVRQRGGCPLSMHTWSAKQAPGLGTMPRTPSCKSCRSSLWGHPIYVSHSQVLSWRLLDCENYVSLISTSLNEPRAHLDI